MTDRTLPSGQVIRGVPDNFTNAQLKEYAIANGLATEEDYNRDMKTNADYFSLVGEIGGSVGGAIAGAKYGASVGTAVSPFFGTLIGGAVGAATGYFAGEVIESYSEDRDFDVEKETQNALKAGATDAAFGGAFGVLGKGLSAVYKHMRAMFQPVYLKGGNESEVAETVLAIRRGETTLEEVAARGDINAEFVKSVEESLVKRTEDLERAARLQSKLADSGTGLFPSQAVPEYKGMGLAQDYSSSSYLLGKNYDETLKGQDDYITAQFTELVGRATTDKTREETGIALAKLVQDSDKALQAVVDPLYKAIDKEGAVFVGTGNVKNAVRRGYDKLRAKTSSQQSVMKAVNAIPARLTPAEVVKQKRKLTQLLPNVAGDPIARKMINSALKNLDGTLARNKNLVRPASTIALGKEALNLLTNKFGETGISGGHKEIAQKLNNLRKDMSFSEAHKELSELKARQRNMQKSVGEKSTQAEKLINRAIGELENSMESAAKNFNPELKIKYNNLKNMYKEGVDTIHGKWITKALNKDNVADIGQYLVKSGENIGVNEVKALIAKAKELKVDNAGNNILESIEKEFLNNLFPQKNTKEGVDFVRRMNTAKFRDTFNAIVGKEKGDKLVELGKEIKQLSDGIKGSESALSLSVRSGELSGIRKPTLGGGVSLALIGAFVKKAMSPEKIQSQINQLKIINKKLLKGEPIPKGLMTKFMENAGQTGAGAGLAIGATVPQE